MSKRIKDLENQELQKRYGERQSLCVVSVSKMDAISTNRLRGELRDRHLSLHVVRNHLAKLALGDGPLGPLVKSLTGPNAFVEGEGSVVDIAKELARLSEQYPALELRDGILEGDVEPTPVADIAKMKSRVELLGEVVMLMTSPARRIAGCVTGPGGRVAGCVKAVAERKEKEPEAAAA